MASPSRVTAIRLAGLSLLLAFHGAALAWRCNSRLVEPGQTLFEIGETCGEPDSVDRRTEWRLQTVWQAQCQTLHAPIHPAPAIPSPGPIPRPRTVCTPIPISYSVPVEIVIWYYADASVPKALYFENGRLAWIESLWHLRH